MTDTTYTKTYFERCDDVTLRQYASYYPSQFATSDLAAEVLNERLKDRPKEIPGPLDEGYDPTAWRADFESQREKIYRTNAEQIQAEQTEQEIRNAKIFVQSNPQFKPCPENADAIEGYLKRNNMRATLDNISNAAGRLASEGRLQLNTTTEPDAPTITEAETLPLDQLRELIVNNANRDTLL